MSVLEMEPGLATIVSGGPMESPNAELGTGPAMVIDLMGEGSVIEKNPTPVASIIANQPAAEAILQRMFGPSPEEGDEHVQPGERFTPYELTGDPAEIFGGISVIGQDPESVASANAFVRRLLGSIQRPEDEAATTPETVINKDDQADPESGLGRNLLTAFRRSRLAKAVSTGAFVVSGALYLASSAEAEASAFTGTSVLSASPSTEAVDQACLDEGLTPWKNILASKMNHAQSKHGAGWSGLVKLQIDGMPCTDLNRYMNIRVLMEKVDPKNGKPERNANNQLRWINIYPWNGDNNSMGDLANNAGVGGASFYNINYVHNHHWTKDNYVCTKGPGKTQVKFQVKNTVEDSNGNIVGGPQITSHPVTVNPAC